MTRSPCNGSTGGKLHMKIHFLGVGEACEARQANTSILLQTAPGEGPSRILLDCGFSVPPQYFSLEPDPEGLEILWISHFHGDHFLGTPLLLLWFWEMGRQNPLQILGPPGVAEKVTQATDLAYPHLLPRLGFSLLFQALQPGEVKKIADTCWQAAYSEHSQPCLSLRLETQDRAVFYSGDGRPTPETRALAAGSSLIIHEAYGLENTTPGHGSLATCLDFARNAGVTRLALVHMQRHIRPQASTMIERTGKNYPEIEIMLPEQGSTINV
jgi:ribonuclease Z